MHTDYTIPALLKPTDRDATGSMDRRKKNREHGHSYQKATVAILIEPMSCEASQILGRGLKRMVLVPKSFHKCMNRPHAL